MTPGVPVFPAGLQSAGSTLLQALTRPDEVLVRHVVAVRVLGEPLALPYRLYCSRALLWSVVGSSSDETRPLALALGTRHEDGHVREACLEPLLAIHRPWIAPFVVQLLGEYVAEIVERIEAAVPMLETAAFAAFVRENPAYVAATRRRAISDWACYHRGRWPELRSSPALRALDAIERAARTVPHAPPA